LLNWSIELLNCSIEIAELINRIVELFNKNCSIVVDNYLWFFGVFLWKIDIFFFWGYKSVQSSSVRSSFGHNFSSVFKQFLLNFFWQILDFLYYIIITVINYTWVNIQKLYINLLKSFKFSRNSKIIKNIFWL
jgi:hypothetical protein